MSPQDYHTACMEARQGLNVRGAQEFAWLRKYLDADSNQTHLGMSPEEKEQAHAFLDLLEEDCENIVQAIDISCGIAQQPAGQQRG
jgi:hypothetical protein